MCGCSTGCDSINTGVLPIGPTGAAGATGARGEYGGFSSDWVFSTSTGSGPASTNIRLNSATYSAVTTIYISNVNADALDLTNFLLSFENNSNFGYIRLFNQTDNTKYWYGQITALVNNVSEIVLTVTYIDHNDSFSAADSVVVTFSPSGSASPSILYSNTTAVSTSSGVMTSLMSYTLPANQLSIDDDTVEFSFAVDTSAVLQIKTLELRLNGVACHTKVPIFPLSAASKYMSIVATITRQSATTAFIKFDIFISGVRYNSITGYHFFENAVAFNNLSTLTNTIALFARNTNAAPTETIRANQMLVKYFNK